MYDGSIRKMGVSCDKTNIVTHMQETIAFCIPKCVAEEDECWIKIETISLD